MNVISSSLVSLFNVICWIAAIATVSYCIYVFSLNEDLCIVDYKKYYDNEFDVYPKLSICLKNPFSRTGLNSSGSNQTYLDFLKGRYFHPNMVNINYNTSIFNLSEQVSKYFINWRNGSKTNYVKKDFGALLPHSHALHWYDMFYQCYELETPPDNDVDSVFVHVNSSVFPPRTQPHSYGLVTSLH